MAAPKRGFGEGAELRRPLGVTILGGLLVSQLLTLYTTPVIYIYLDRLQRWTRRPWRIAEQGQGGGCKGPFGSDRQMKDLVFVGDGFSVVAGLSQLLRHCI
jgi:hypothetical protein